MHIDVVIRRVLYNRLDQFRIYTTHAAAGKTTRVRRGKRHYDGNGDTNRCNVDMSSNRRQGNARHTDLKAQFTLAVVQGDAGRATAIRVTRSGHFGRSGEGSRE